MLKYVQVSAQLQTFQYLKGRMKFTQDQAITYNNLYKGYLGERKFSKVLDKKLKSHCIVLFGLLLESKNNLFQVDCLLIYRNEIFLIEIKNYIGDFYVQDEKWYVCSSDKEIKNPLHQLERSAYLLREFLSTYGLKYRVNPYVVFINNEFTLYHAPRYSSIIFPTQINRFIQKLNQTPSLITSKHRKLANRLIAAHITTSPYEKLPEYHFLKLRRGIFCYSCRGQMQELQKGKMHCRHCGYFESIDSALMRSILEFNLLFPNKKITTSIIHEWSALNRTNRTIRRILKKYLVYVQNYRHSYFAFEKPVHKSYKGVR